MFGSQVLDVGVGMVLIYLLLSIICSVLAQGAMFLFKMREGYLYAGIREMLNPQGDRRYLNDGIDLTYALYQRPLLSTLVVPSVLSNFLSLTNQDQGGGGSLDTLPPVASHADLTINKEDNELFPASTLAKVPAELNVDVAAPMLWGPIQLPEFTRQTLIIGLDPESDEQVHSHVIVHPGEFLKPGDLMTAVIGRVIEQKLGWHVGDKILLYCRKGMTEWSVERPKVSIVGLPDDTRISVPQGTIERSVELSIVGIVGPPDDTRILVPLRTLQGVSSIPGKINRMDMRLKASSQRVSVQKKLTDLLDKTYHVQVQGQRSIIQRIASVLFIARLWKLVTSPQLLPTYIPPRWFALALLDMIEDKNSELFLNVLGGPFGSAANQAAYGKISPLFSLPNMGRGSRYAPEWPGSQDQPADVVLNNLNTTKINPADLNEVNKALIAEKRAFAVRKLQDQNAQFKNLEANLHDIKCAGLRNVLQAIFTDADGDLGQVRKSIEHWFTWQMHLVDSWIARDLRGITLIIASLLTLFLNADSFAIPNRLLRDTTSRAIVLQAAASSSLVDAVGATNTYAETLRIPLGWKNGAVSEVVNEITSGSDIVGALIKILSKLVGMAVTVLFLSMGTPFWIDQIRRFFGQATAGTPGRGGALPASDSGGAGIGGQRG